MATARAPVQMIALLHRLDVRDRALFVRWVMQPSTPRRRRTLWMVLTHLGGLYCTVLTASIPLFGHGLLRRAAELSLWTLVVSHLIVQAIKRSVGRPRPSLGTSCATLINEPDKFSFPSGHAAAAMSLAFGFAVALPSLALPLFALATLIGASRVCLGVHYPGDVFAGQVIALCTGALLLVM
jgi:undecaprenyl-diphosphatase